MKIASFDIVIKKGDTGIVANPQGIVMTFPTGDDATIDLTIAEIRLLVIWDNQVGLERSSKTSDKISIDTTTGKVIIDFAGDEFAAVNAGAYMIYELKIYYDDRVKTFLHGKIDLVG